MFNALFESSWPIVAAAILIEALLVIILIQTGRGKLILAIAAVALLAVGGLVVEQLVVTPKEEVEVTLQAISSAAEANDTEGVTRHLAPEASELVQEAQRVLAKYDFHEVSVRSLEVTPIQGSDGPMIEARFTVRIDADDPGMENPYRAVPWRLKVKLRKAGDRWLVVSYEETSMLESPP
jgi:hypothetical protein